MHVLYNGRRQHMIALTEKSRFTHKLLGEKDLGNQICTYIEVEFLLQGQGAQTYFVVVLSAEENGDEGQPDDARAVHGEADVLGLVEVLRDLSRLESVPRAERDDDEVVGERNGQAVGGHAARQDGRLPVGVDHLNGGRLDEEPDDHAQKLDINQTWK